MKQRYALFVGEIQAFLRGWYFYIEKRMRRVLIRFEAQKGLLVEILMARRGTYQRPFLHLSLLLLFVVGVMSAPILASSNSSNTSDFTPPSAALTSLDMAEYGVSTQISEKPRDQVITYTVQKGDTFSTVSEKFGVSVDTIKWANNTRSDALAVKQELKIPPVTGVVHKVKEGETIYSIAKKYKTDAQKILNFPFNDFTDLDTFALQVGQTVVVPDGVIAEAAAVATARPSVIVGGTGQFQWPTNGVITQYPIWYHNAVDIASPSAPGIVASDRGTVVVVQYLRYGYGHHVLIEHGDGLSSLYGHMSDIYVNVGDVVNRGQVIGRMGSTGRSTGTHLHFEIRKNGTTVNPLPFLK